MPEELPDFGSASIHPETIHRGAQDLPFVEISPGYFGQVVHVNLATGLWVSRSRLVPGYRSPRHYHSGEVFGLTNSGRWFYLEEPHAINSAGSYLYEPAGSIHTQCIPEDNIEPVDIWFLIRGRVESMDEAGTIISSTGAADMLTIYTEACRKIGIDNPPIIMS